jgi:hypothetical protein
MAEPKMVAHVFESEREDGSVLRLSVGMPEGDPVPAVTDAAGNTYVYCGIAPEEDEVRETGIYVQNLTAEEMSGETVWSDPSKYRPR